MVGEARRNNMIRIGGGGEPDRHPQYPPEGDSPGELADPRAGKGTPGSPRPRSTLKGKRDYVILALLVGCALRRNELAELDAATIQQREGRWVLADVEGKGRCHRLCGVQILKRNEYGSLQSKLRRQRAFQSAGVPVI